LLFFFVAFNLCEFAFSDEHLMVVTGGSHIPSVVSVISDGRTETNQPEVKKTSGQDLAWNKWDVGNFVILSLDKSQGLHLKSNICDMCDEALEGFGMGSDLSGSYKIVCVPDNATLKKMFGLDSSHVESDGVSGSVWLSMEESEMLPSLLVSACAEDAAPKVGFFVLRGAYRLSKPTKFVESALAEATEVDSESLFKTTKEQWLKKNEKDREAFDRESALCCLMFRKEIGKVRFSKFINRHYLKNAMDESSPSSLGFKDFSHLDSVLSRYSKNLSSDLRDGKTPHEYLQIK
jgi:hypothetical protein